MYRLTLAALFVALALPASASAAYTSSISGTTVTFTGDAGNDNLVIDDDGTNLTHNQTGGDFASNKDFDTATAGEQALPADNTITIAINAGDGQDSTVFNTRGVLAATINGEAGDDVLGGTDGVDSLSGGDGEDRLVAAGGDDTMIGGANADVLVWNNGDGTDVMEGEGGADTAEFNGSVNAGDVVTIAPGPGGRVEFDRTNLGVISLDIGTTENFAVNGLGGDDTITSLPGAGALIAHDLNGGPGADTINGSEAPDLIRGGDDADVLNGGGSFDRILGDRGDDTMNGDAGDDTLVWNNGDGTDAMNGGEGIDRIEVNGSVSGADVFTVKPQTGGARFDRTNVGLFGLNIVASEQLDVRGLGGDDSLTVSPGTPLELLANCGEGTDTLTTADARVLLIEACENVSTPSARDRAAVIRGGLRLARNRGSISARVQCPAIQTDGCQVALTLASATPLRVGPIRSVLVLGTARATLDAGQTRRISVRIPAGLARALARTRRSVRIAASVVSTDADGFAAQSRRALSLKLRAR